LSLTTKRISAADVQQLLRRAAELEAMAADAVTTTHTKEALLRLAARYRTAASPPAARDAPVTQHPGEMARMGGLYKQLNIFGTPTGATVRAKQGEPLPAAPRGFTWRLAGG
jgi:hypothetical protein